MMEDVEKRVERIENELNDIREAVKNNTKNISKLYSSVSALGAKVDTLVREIGKQSDTINSVFMQYKSIVDKLINSQSRGEKMKWDTFKVVVEYLAYISIIAISAGFGLKLLLNI